MHIDVVCSFAAFCCCSSCPFSQCTISIFNWIPICTRPLHVCNVFIIVNNEPNPTTGHNYECKYVRTCARESISKCSHQQAGTHMVCISISTLLCFWCAKYVYHECDVFFLLLSIHVDVFWLDTYIECIDWKRTECTVWNCS